MRAAGNPQWKSQGESPRPVKQARSRSFCSYPSPYQTILPVERIYQGERRGVSPTCASEHVGLTPRRSPFCLRFSQLRSLYFMSIAILISGGLDSAILLGESLRQSTTVHPLYIRTG